MNSLVAGSCHPTLRLLHAVLICSLPFITQYKYAISMYAFYHEAYLGCFLYLTIANNVACTCLLGEHVYIFLLDICLGVKLLDHSVCVNTDRIE